MPSNDSQQKQQPSVSRAATGSDHSAAVSRPAVSAVQPKPVLHASRETQAAVLPEQSEPVERFVLQRVSQSPGNANDTALPPFQLARQPVTNNVLLQLRYAEGRLVTQRKEGVGPLKSNVFQLVTKKNKAFNNATGEKKGGKEEKPKKKKKEPEKEEYKQVDGTNYNEKLQESIEKQFPIAFIVNTILPYTEADSIEAFITNVINGKDMEEMVKSGRIGIVIGLNAHKKNAKQLTEAMEAVQEIINKFNIPIAVVSSTFGTKKFPYGTMRNNVLHSAETHLLLQTFIRNNYHPYVSIQDADTAPRTVPSGEHIFKYIEKTLAFTDEDVDMAGSDEVIETGEKMEEDYMPLFSDNTEDENKVEMQSLPPLRPLMITGGYRPTETLMEDTKSRVEKRIGQLEKQIKALNQRGRELVDEREKKKKELQEETEKREQQQTSGGKIPEKKISGKTPPQKVVKKGNEGKTPSRTPSKVPVRRTVPKKGEKEKDEVKKAPERSPEEKRILKELREVRKEIKEVVMEREKLEKELAGNKNGLKKLNDEKKATKFRLEFEKNIKEDMRMRTGLSRVHPLLPYAPEPNLFLDGFSVLLNKDLPKEYQPSQAISDKRKDVLMFGKDGAEYTDLGRRLPSFGAFELDNYYGKRHEEAEENIKIDNIEPFIGLKEDKEDSIPEMNQRPPIFGHKLLDESKEDVISRLNMDTQNNRHPLRGISYLTDFEGASIQTDLSRIAYTSLISGKVPQSHGQLTSVVDRLVQDKSAKKGLKLSDFQGEYDGFSVKRKKKAFSEVFNPSLVKPNKKRKLDVSKLGNSDTNKMSFALSTPFPSTSSFSSIKMGIQSNQQQFSFSLTALSKQTELRRYMELLQILNNDRGTPLDGDCLYNAIVQAQTGKLDPEAAQQIRNTTVDWMLDERNLENVATYAYENGVDIFDLIRVIRTKGAWTGNAGDLAPRLVAAALGINLRIYVNGNPTMIRPLSGSGKGRVSLDLEDNHYSVHHKK
ncbi:hypothetical protein [Chitinophaga agri]|uniref:OTU domain-containing protein n=1 Tax=Chitinophaga agri TaxID=2703787 RepID=A0A6B9ZC20_9BACT|nr:hypothetical protein [Chitinophaga agri]QHS59962.1 hypothetical protein GWR21_10265 [Chitinophaga agri]